MVPTADTSLFLKMFKFDKILDFSQNDIKKYADVINATHKVQIRQGMDIDGNPFKRYTQDYARRKAAGKTGKRDQINFSTDPVNFTLTGQMFDKFRVQSAKMRNDIQIKYGIRKSKAGTKLDVNDARRRVAEDQKLGPLVEEKIAVGIAEMVARNISKQHGVPVVLHI